MILYPVINENIEHILIEADSIVKKSTDEIVSHSENFYNDDLIEFENLNNSCESIYDLGDNQVLIILKDGRNITSWDNISEHYFNDIKFISEDFSNCYDLSQRYNDVRGKWDDSDYQIRYNLFDNVTAMIIRNISQSCTDLSQMFEGCRDLKTLAGLETWDTSNVVNMDGMFSGCINFKTYNQLSFLNMGNVKSIFRMFKKNDQLVNLKFMENWDVKNLKNIDGFCSQCSNLISLDGLQNWNTRKLENILVHFSGVIILKTLMH